MCTNSSEWKLELQSVCTKTGVLGMKRLVGLLPLKVTSSVLKYAHKMDVLGVEEGGMKI